MAIASSFAGMGDLTSGLHDSLGRSLLAASKFCSKQFPQFLQTVL
jgi:hypothetical protein